MKRKPSPRDAVAVPERICRAAELLRETQIDLRDIARVRAWLRSQSLYYAAAWIGNHQNEWRDGAIKGFRADSQYNYF
jgi:hypothetical protein